MKRICSLVFCLVAFSNSAHAIDMTGNFAVWGVGKKSCISFQKDYKEGNVVPYKEYMKGYITAYNFLTDNTYSISGNMNETKVIEWIDAFCSDNPMSSYESAINAFTFDFFDQRSKSASSGAGGSGSW